MKAQDPAKPFGSVVGKALHPLKLGRGQIPVLVALQQAHWAADGLARDTNHHKK